MGNARRACIAIGGALFAFSIAFAFAMVGGCGIDAVATGTATGDVDAAASTDAIVTTPDGPAFDAAELDSGSQVPVGAAGFCAREAQPFVACWDFDDVSAGGDPGFTSKNGGPIDVVVEGVNHVLRISVPSPYGAKQAYVQRDLAPYRAFSSVYDVRFKFAVRSSTLDYAAFAAFFLTGANVSRFVGAASYGQGGNALDMLYPDQSPKNVPAQAGPTWHSARIHIAGTTDAVQGTTVIDGVVVGDVATAIGPVTIDLRLGVYFTSYPVGSLEMVFDDIVIRAE